MNWKSWRKKQLPQVDAMDIPVWVDVVSLEALRTIGAMTDGEFKEFWDHIGEAVRIASDVKKRTQEKQLGKAA